MKKKLPMIILSMTILTILIISCKNDTPAPQPPDPDPTDQFHASIWKEIAILKEDGSWDSLDSESGDTLLFRTENLDEEDSLLFSEGTYTYSNPKLGNEVISEGEFEIVDSTLTFVTAETDTSFKRVDFRLELVKNETDTTLEIKNLDSLLGVKFKNIGVVRDESEAEE